MERKMLDLTNIYIPKKMQKAKPKQYKIMGMEAYFKKYKHFYGSVILDKNYNLLDGYVIYYTARKNKIKEIPVTIVSTKDRLKHFLKRIRRKL